MVKILVLDPGHGGTDPGAVGNGLLEKVLTLDISNRIKNYLEMYYEGVTIYLTRTTDKTMSLSERTNFANAKGADYLASIHINAFNGEANGYEDYIYNGGVSSTTVKGQDLIHAEIKEAISAYNVFDRGQKEANFHMLRESNMPAILTENLFIDSAKDSALLKNSAFLSALAKGHGEGIARLLALPKKVVASTSSSAGDDELYRVQVGAYSDYNNAKKQLDKLEKAGFKGFINKG